MKSTLLNVPLGQIIMLGNYRDVEPVSETDPDIIELAASIKKNKVMQAILLRPGKKPNTYELIFGHRRYVASKVAGEETIPSNIMEVPDEKILEIQVTENLQRKDPHPMDEAVAFKALQQKYKYNTEEIGLRFGKSHDYVVQRIKLNDLIPEAQVKFKTKGGTMLLGHALLIARLTPEDQKTLVNKYGDYGSVQTLQKHIDNEVTRNLKKATFDTKDEKLFPQAGPCTTCPKRTGCQPLLFADVKSPDTCMDSSCFAVKTNKAFETKLTDLVNNKPEILIVEDYYGSIPKEINNLLQSMKVKVYKNMDNVRSTKQEYNGYTVKAKGFWISGSQKGTTTAVWLKANKKAIEQAGTDATKENVQQVIAGIKERQDRALVLDTCKVHHAIIAEAEKIEEKITQDTTSNITPAFRGIQVFLLLEQGGIDNGEYKWLPKEPQGHGYFTEYFMALSKLTDQQISTLIRAVVYNKFRNKNLQYGVSERDTPIKLIAEHFGIDTKAIQEAQDQKAAKRKESADKRIADLKKPPKTAEKTAPAPKQAPMPPNSRAKRAEQAKKPAKKAAVKKAAKKK